ncbi:MAG: DUF6011 domain-containing protein [Anaerolineales bacterium]
MTGVSSVKCRVCGRQLHNPISVAMGIGPKCAGGRPGTERRIRARPRTASHRLYASNAHLTTQTMPLIGTTELVYRDQLLRLVTVPSTREQFCAELANMKRGTKKKLRRLRWEMLLARRTFCAGAFFMNEEQCMYEPVNEDSWREVHSPRVIRSLDLESYLNRIGVIATERKVTQQQHIL